VLRNIEEQSAAVDARARALSERASAELKWARDRIQALEMDCERLDGLLAESKGRMLAAEEALQGAEGRTVALETELAAAKRRATDAENMLILVEDTIRSDILQPMRSNTRAPEAA
jgi:chromosome segregation ATPase